VKFLVRIDIALPPMPADEHAALVDAERAAGQALRQAGVLERIWRVPGEGLRNAGIWAAADERALRDRIATLPMAPWMTVEVTELAPHPLELDA
jgi:muconolactone D-isomerase